jgi:hypothetical protein
MKTCGKCKIEKRIKDFGKNKLREDGLQAYCKVCCKERDKNSYSKRKNYYTKASREAYLRNRSFVNRWKKIYGKCVDCGNEDYRVLDFDHIEDNKLNNVATLVNGHGLKTIKNEIRKCEIRCANCHRVKTFERKMLL